MRFSIVWTAAVTLLIVSVSLAQQPEPEHRDDKWKADPHAFCRKGPDDPERPSEHACACDLKCSEGSDTVRQEQMENPACQMYCSRQRCLCWTDNPCDKPKLDFNAK